MDAPSHKTEDDVRQPLLDPNAPSSPVPTRLGMPPLHPASAAGLRPPAVVVELDAAPASQAQAQAQAQTQAQRPPASAPIAVPRSGRSSPAMPSGPGSASTSMQHQSYAVVTRAADWAHLAESDQDDTDDDLDNPTAHDASADDGDAHQPRRRHSLAKFGISATGPLTGTGSPTDGPVAWRISTSEAVTDDMVAIAALYLKDATHGRAIGYRVDPASRQLYRQYHAGWWRACYMVIALMHMALIMFEPPTVPDWLWVSNFFPPAIELGCVCIYVYDLFLLYRFFSAGYHRTAFWRHKWSLCRIAVIILTLIDIALYWASGYTSLRFSPPFRPLMIFARTRNARQTLIGVLSAMFKMIPVLITAFLVIFFFAFLGAAVLGHLGAQATTFSSLGTAIYNMVLIYTSTTTSSAITYPYYKVNPWLASFFVLFLVIGNMLLVKLSIASAFRSFKEYAKAKMLTRLAKRQDALNEAYRILARESEEGVGVTKAVWFRVMRSLHRRFPEEMLDMMFHSVGSHSNIVHKKEFMTLCALTEVQYVPGIDWHGWPITNAWRRRLRVLLRQRVTLFGQQIIAGDLAMSAVLILSAVQLHQESKLRFGAATSAAWTAVGMIVLMVFIAESALRFFALGWHRYRDLNFQLFNDVCNAVGIFLYLVLDSHPQYRDTPVSNLFLVVLMLRLVRLLDILPVTIKILRTIYRVWPAVMRLLFVVFSAIYAWAVIGMAIYHDKLVTTAPEVKGTSWVQLGDQQTFQTFPNAALTVFWTAILSGWPVIMDAAVRVQGPGSYAYFFLVNLTLAVVLIPTFVGFVLETFASNYNTVESEMERQEQFFRERRQAVADARQTDLLRAVARGDGGDDDSDAHGDAAPKPTLLSASQNSRRDVLEEDVHPHMNLTRKHSDANYATFNVAAMLQQGELERIKAKNRRLTQALLQQTQLVEKVSQSLVATQAELQRTRDALKSLSSPGAIFTPTRPRTMFHERSSADRSTGRPSARTGSSNVLADAGHDGPGVLEVSGNLRVSPTPSVLSQVD